MRLIDLKRDTNFTLQNQSAVKGQKLGLCQQSLIFLSHRRVSPFSRGVIFTRARVLLSLPSLRKTGDDSQSNRITPYHGSPWFFPCFRGWFWQNNPLVSMRDINLTFGLLPPPRRHMVWRDSVGVEGSRSGLKSECADMFHQSFRWLLRHTEKP